MYYKLKVEIEGNHNGSKVLLKKEQYIELFPAPLKNVQQHYAETASDLKTVLFLML